MGRRYGSPRHSHRQIRGSNCTRRQWGRGRRVMHPFRGRHTDVALMVSNEGGGKVGTTKSKVAQQPAYQEEERLVEPAQNR
jgi:hypothetical protein